jgi:acetyltransferase-like isoleucine patch superfamily enzyme
MKRTERIVTGEYRPVRYTQFEQSRRLRILRRLAGWVAMPLVLPLVVFAKISEEAFRTAAEMVKDIPYAVGIVVREQFYRWTLTRSGTNVVIGAGTVFSYRDVAVGDNVLIGMYNIIHYCDFGSNVMVADHCQFLSGAKYHNFDRVDIPMSQQGGLLTRIQIGDDCWVGAGAIVIASVGRGSVVGAGAVVTREVEPYSVVAGNPAKLIRKRS